MNIIESIEVEDVSATTLQVFHRRLRIPISVYLEQMAHYPDPWNERAYQSFVQKYLEEINDPGIVGMVRQAKDEKYVYLDAALRYPKNHNL
ncbi:MAG: hypothetical protein GX958_09170 [Desulfitobacterium sp.]|nr:hypothetical protein [Desulfitobacterium sp.]